MAKEDINSLIFKALHVSAMSKVPFLFMGNPGTGKTTSVEYFCEIEGYEMILLRGSQSSPEEILGYDVNEGNADHTATRLIPRWFANLKKSHDEGHKILLFLDEITTASEYVQGALLHLIFERRVGDEKLPNDTLIVAAGNYSSNLSSNFNLIPPLMNRFCIFNITPSNNDLRSFLSKYQSSGTYGKNRLMSLKGSVNPDLSEENISTVKAMIENQIYEFVSSISKTGELDLSITELKDIYQDDSSSSILPGFISYRSLNYYRECSIATYLMYGIQGILSDTFRLITLGLVGIGLGSKKNRNGSEDVDKVNFTDRFISVISKTVTEFEKGLASTGNKYIAQIMNVIDKYLDSSMTIEKSMTVSSDDICEFENVVRNLDASKSRGDKVIVDSDIVKIMSFITEVARDRGCNLTKDNINQNIIDFNSMCNSCKVFDRILHDFSDIYDSNFVTQIERGNIQMMKKLVYRITYDRDRLSEKEESVRKIMSKLPEIQKYQ